MLTVDLERMRESIRGTNLFQGVGRLRAAYGILEADVPARLQELCEVHAAGARPVLAEVVGFRDNKTLMLPYALSAGVRTDAKVVALRRSVLVPFGSSLLGRIIDGLGQPVDGKGALQAEGWREASTQTPPALSRRRIDKPLPTGQRAIDAFLTMGVGQRVGLFAGSGVGKSTLLGEIAKYSSADYNVIALVGERGREVRPFIEDCLGPRGMERSVVVLATASESALMRVRAVQTAVTIANEFRQRGSNVLFMLDSLTRLAMAQREIGLALGEPPTARGYTPSVFQLMASVLEQLGNNDRGSVSAIATVLVDADDMNDPIADSARAILDGHIVLSRALAERAHFPAIDVAASISRSFHDVTDKPHQQMAQKLRVAMSTFQRNADLIYAGAYEPGASREIDASIQLMPRIEANLKQERDEHTDFAETLARFQALAQEWP